MFLKTIVPASVTLAAVITVMPPATAQDPTGDKRKLLSGLLEKAFGAELAGVEFRHEKSGRETTRIRNPIKDIVIHTDWSVSVKGRFVDPGRKLTVNVTQLERQKDGSNLVTLEASAPIKGEIWGEIKTVGKTRVEFTAQAQLKLKGKLKRKAGSEADYEAAILDWKGHFDQVVIKPDLARFLSGEARNAANRALADQNDNLKTLANRALAKAATEGRLRLDP